MRRSLVVLVGIGLAAQLAAGPVKSAGTTAEAGRALQVHAPVLVDQAVAPVKRNSEREAASKRATRNEVRTWPVKRKTQTREKVTAPVPAPTKKSTTAGLWPGATGVWAGQPAWVRAQAVCIVGVESLHAGLYEAVNIGHQSSATGLAQWVSGTWRSHLRSAGFSAKWARAKDAPAWVQDRVLAWAIKHSRRSWSYSC